MKDDLHIVISCDENYAKHAVIMLKSIEVNNSNDFNIICFHVLAHNLQPLTQNVLKKNICEEKTKIHFYDISDIDKRLGIEIPNTIAINAYARLFIASILPHYIDRVIYCDCDAIVNDSFKELVSINLSGISVGGVLDHVSDRAKTELCLPLTAPYINSGFLLINLVYWRENKIEDKFIEYLKEKNGVVFHHDQGLINKICNTSLKVLHPKYNMVSNFFVLGLKSFNMTPFYTEEELKEGLESPTFIHFTPGVVNRPWIKNCRHPLKKHYIFYRNKTTLKDFPLDEDKRPRKLKILSYLFFNFRPIYNIVIQLREWLVKKI